MSEDARNHDETTPIRVAVPSVGSNVRSVNGISAAVQINGHGDHLIPQSRNGERDCPVVPAETVIFHDLSANVEVKPSHVVADPSVLGSSSNPSAAGKGKQAVKARGQWGHQIEFLLAILGYQVGYGNIWRFPYLLYENGGGTFLVPYVIAFLLVALPMVLLEEGAGQFAGLGAVKIYRAICPAMRGVGITSLFISWSCGVYFAMIMGWIIVYCYYACFSTIPWSTCKNDWNTPECFAAADQEECGPGQFFYDKFCTSAVQFCQNFSYEYSNTTGVCQSSFANGTTVEIPLLRVTQRSLSAEQFFERKVLGIFLEDGNQATWANYGTIQWHLLGGLMAVWMLAAAAMIKGIQTTGKVLYFTALFPYIIILFFLVKGALLEGSVEGIGYYLTPVPSKLLDFHVWYAAAAQIFFSSGISFGAHITLSSYSSFNNNILRDASLITIANSVTSFLFGFIIFSMLGFLAKTLGTDVPHVVKDGIGLLFIIIPQSIVGMSIPNLWSWLFFLMIFTVGFCSLTGMMEVVTTAVFDQWPRTRNYKTAVVASVCSLSFLAGLPLCWSGGLYYLLMINDYTINLPLFVVALINFVVFVICFGYDKMLNCYEQMLGKINKAWTNYSLITWKFATPSYLIVVFIASVVGSSASKYGSYTFSPTVHGIGFLTVTLILLPVPIGMVWTLLGYTNRGKPWTAAFHETGEWMSSPVRQSLERDCKVVNGASSSSMADSADKHAAIDDQAVPLSRLRLSSEECDMPVPV